jgi:glyoxylase-like metal-dependent hydrolase (beta-lactamase superfamily II)
MAGTAVEGLTLGELDTNCWIVSDGAGGPLVVIDPAGEAESLIAALGGRSVAVVVLTHGHFDHLGAATAVLEATGAPLLVHSADAAAVTNAAANGGLVFGFSAVAPAPDRELEDGDVVEAGALRLEVIHTPGHTPGSICLFDMSADGGPHLFSGDTLLAGSVGRTDFPGGDPRELRASIGRLAALPPETLVHPGHGPDTTIAREARTNFFWPRA